MTALSRLGWGQSASRWVQAYVVLLLIASRCQSAPDQQLGDQNLCPTTALGRTALLTTWPSSWQPRNHIWPSRASWGSHCQPSSWLISVGPPRAAGHAGDHRLLQCQCNVLWPQAGNGCSPEAAVSWGDVVWWEDGKLWDKQPQGEYSISGKRFVASMTWTLDWLEICGRQKHTR